MYSFLQSFLVPFLQLRLGGVSEGVVNWLLVSKDVSGTAGTVTMLKISAGRTWLSILGSQLLQLLTARNPRESPCREDAHGACGARNRPGKDNLSLPSEMADAPSQRNVCIDIFVCSCEQLIQ